MVKVIYARMVCSRASKTRIGTTYVLCCLKQSYLIGLGQDFEARISSVQTQVENLRLLHSRFMESHDTRPLMAGASPHTPKTHVLKT